MSDKSLNAMAFYHSKGFVPAYKQAKRFAGKGGRIATLLDIVAAKLAESPTAEPTGIAAWERYFTAMSAEYFGKTKGGVKVLIVAHGIGPMADLAGVLKAYKYEYGDKSRRNRGGRISQEEFLKLESGFYGPVFVVDFNGVLSRYQYPFLEYLTAGQSQSEQLLEARLGPDFPKFIRTHVELSREWHEKEGHGLKANPYILKMGHANNCWYEHHEFEDGLTVAHLLQIGNLCQVYHDEYSLCTDVNCHEWGDGVRLAGIRAGSTKNQIALGPELFCGFLERHWQKLMRPTGLSKPAQGFFVLTTVYGEEDEIVFFTQYPKKGPGLDTCEPQYRVTAIEPIGKPVEFETEILGYKQFFKYDIADVKRIAPPRANAYMLAGEPFISRHEDGDPSHQKVQLQFYRIEVDASQRLLKGDEIENDYELRMQFAGCTEAEED